MKQPDNVDPTCISVDGVLTCLTRGDTAGLTMKVAASLLSLGSLLYTFFFILRQLYTNRKTKIHYNPMDLLVFSLLFADFLQAIGGMLSLRWILDGVVEIGKLCDGQATLNTIGQTGVGLSTLLVAIYTFVVVFTGMGLHSMRTTAVIVVGIWVFIGTLVGIGYGTHRDPSRTRFMSPVPYWCWVSGEYTAWRIVGEYLWLWISLFGSILLYIPLFLWMRGKIVLTEGGKWTFQWKASDSNAGSSRRRGLIMLVYPIVYCICILPLSVVRWMSFTEVANYGTTSVPPAATFAAITIFDLSGFFNVILTFSTKPNLGLFGQQASAGLGRPPTGEHVN